MSRQTLSAWRHTAEDSRHVGVPAQHGFVLYLGGRRSNELHPGSLEFLGGIGAAVIYRAALFRLYDKLGA